MEKVLSILRQIIVFSIICLLNICTLYAQNEYNMLRFGDGTIFDFNTSPMTVKNNSGSLYNLYSASICDKNGDLLFFGYEDIGYFFSIYDRNNALIYSKECMRANNIYALRKPNTYNTYYFILTKREKSQLSRGNLLYVKIVINDNGGYDITSNELEAYTGQFLIPYVYKNDVYVVCDKDSDILCTLKLNDDGLELLNEYDANFKVGYYHLVSFKLKFNNEMSKLIFNEGIFDYDISQHKITGYKPFPGRILSFELSEDGYYTYISSGRKLLRCKTSEISSAFENPEIFELLKKNVGYHDMLSCKGNIYAADHYTNKTELNKHFITVIENVNSNDCNLNYSKLEITSPINFFFPYILRTYRSFETEVSCLTADFTYAGHYAESFEWDFGDGSPKSVLKNPSHTYEKEGKYSVTLKVKYSDKEESTIVDEVKIAKGLSPLKVKIVK